MLLIAGQKYAPNPRALAASLASPGAACAGFYRAMKNGIRLHDATGAPFAFVVNNRHGEQFIVSAGRTSDGTIYYMHALTAHAAVTLGLRESIHAEWETMAADRNLARAILAQLSPQDTGGTYAL